MPPFQKENYSIIREIRRVEDAIRTCYGRVENLENKLKRNELHREQQETIQRELDEVRKLLATNEEKLKTLQKQNMKSFAVAAAFCFVCFVIYCLYVLVAEPKGFS